MQFDSIDLPIMLLPLRHLDGRNARLPIGHANSVWRRLDLMGRTGPHTGVLRSVRISSGGASARFDFVAHYPAVSFSPIFVAPAHLAWSIRVRQVDAVRRQTAGMSLHDDAVSVLQMTNEATRVEER